MTPLLTLDFFFALCGLVLAAAGALILRDAAHPKRWGSGAFWLLLAVAVGAGQFLPAAVVGYLVLALTLLAATKQVAAPRFAAPASPDLAERAERLGNRLLWPVLAVPAVAIAGSFFLDRITWEGGVLVATKQLAQVALGLGCVAGLLLAMRTTRESPPAVAQEGRRLLELLGWTLLLPMTLAALGGIFARAGVGDVVAGLVAQTLPVEHPFVAVLAYAAGMTLFTVLLGNAFAAFPVITLGIGLPFIVKAHGGNPAIVGVFGMLCGYCGTLLTPMAANFNLVPVKLLELRDDYAVIRAQVPFAAAIWLFNVAALYVCVYRF